MLETGALVVGGGPAGATAARFLSEGGVDTLLVERDCSYIKPCGGAFPSGGFHEFKLPDHLITREARTMTIVAPSGNRIDIGLSGGAIYITERGHFDSGLRDLAVTGGARIIEGTFEGFDGSKKDHVAVIRSKADGSLLRIRTPYVIAADGITSAVARHCAVGRPDVVYAANLKLDAVADDACEFWFGTRRASFFYSWVFPGSGSSVSVGTGSRYPEGLLAQLGRFLSSRFPESITAPARQERGRPRVFPLPAWGSRPLHKGTILFAGDSAGMVMPVTYEGIYYAMKAGQFAAQAVLSRKPEDYRRLWDSRFRRRFQIMNAINSYFFRNDTAIERWTSLHRNPEIQELAMSLWLRKEEGSRTLTDYFKAFGRLLSA